jgi:hypothetical protein
LLFNDAAGATNTGEFQRQKKGLFKEYYFFKDKILWVMFFLDIVSNFLEKTNKLLHWHDAKTSRRFLILLLFIFTVVSFLPIRFFIVLGLIRKFNRGKTYYQRRYTGNMEACKIEIRNFLLENGYLKKEDPQKMWVSQQWPKSMGAKKLEAKLTLHL